MGVGSCLFTAPILGIKLGIDPSQKMGKIAVNSGIKATNGVTESLHFHDSQFDFFINGN